ncbi:Large subunit GTPase 1 -like protein [Trichinella nativa]|uniref:Large subunit GTPase 1 homolog n=1 Tax=Trichinella nativa TaxID=6335 RepID=A0A0V1LER8_9BILA|nr:Large subunit GTPase 1 -like protein [Trichinella nativa]
MKKKKKSRKVEAGHLLINHLIRRSAKSSCGHLYGNEAVQVPLRSITEETNLEEFFSRAELLGSTFAAERMNAIIVNNCLPNNTNQRDALYVPEDVESELKVPRRPDWHGAKTAESLAAEEQRIFTEWRCRLNALHAKSGLVLTPYEKNPDIWRQLWRVLEISDVVVQVLDARNPYMFRVPDLELYVKELSSEKKIFLLLNKADLISAHQRKLWANHFNSVQNISYAFWSAQKVINRPSFDAEVKEDVEVNAEDDEETAAEEAEDKEDEKNKHQSIEIVKKLLSMFKSLRSDHSRPLVVGMVGYPNVGKSSTINKLLQRKKVAVSKTPGKTKHLQTLYLDDELILCDAPGLVFPAATFRREHMVLNGMLSSNVVSDYVTPVRQLCSVLPLYVFESIYGIVLSEEQQAAEQANPDNADVLLNALAYRRGFMSAKGLPDRSRSARQLIQDCVIGKLPYSSPPPDVDPKLYNDFSSFSVQRTASKLSTLNLLQRKNLIKAKITAEDVDREFFSSSSSGVHFRGRVPGSAMPVPVNSKKHYNRNKKEKLRRIITPTFHHAKAQISRTKTVDNNLHESKIMQRYRLKSHEEYTSYSKLSHEVRELARKIKELDPKDPFRVESSRLLIDKCYAIGLIPTRRGLDLRRLPVLMVKSNMVENLATATKFVEHGHVRVGPVMISDPAFIVPRNLEDFITWTNTSAVRKHVLEYNDMKDDYDLIDDHFVDDLAKKNKRPQGDCDAAFSEWAVRNNFSVLEYSRTCQAAASGVAAGILGLTGLAGFVFYFLCALAQSCVWYWKTDCCWKDYFPNFSTILLHGLFGGLFTYVLFWTFLYGIVHVY